MEELKKITEPTLNSSTRKDSNDFSTTRLRVVGTANRGNTFA